MSKSKHIALVVYYWPPSGGSGVQRWLFFANYFVNNGFEITVFTSSKPRIAEKDDMLVKKIDPKINVIYVDGWEPMQQSTKEIGENIGQKRGVLSLLNLIRFIRANFFIPDARVFWAKKAAKTFLKLHFQNNFDVLITSGPPHSMHRVGLQSKLKSSIPWIADFRDPWVGFFQNKSLPMCAFAKRKHKKLQNNVIAQADRVVVTAPSLATYFKKMNNSVSVLTNGYESILPVSSLAPRGFVYAGSLKAQQNPKLLWESIAELTRENTMFAETFSLSIYGKTAYSVLESVKEYNIENWVKFSGYQPKEVLDSILPSAKALLLLGIDMPDTQNIIHGKLFEYMAANRPILGIGPKPSDMEPLFVTHKLGVYASFDDKDLIKKTLLSWFLNDEITFHSQNISNFKRDVIAKNYAHLILETR